MRKFLVMLMIIVCNYYQSHAQNLLKSTKYNISFETSEVLENYETESDSVLGYDNDNYAVDIVVAPFSGESQAFLNDVHYGAKELATDMEFSKIIEGGTIPHIKDAYYVIGKEKEDNLWIPVYILVILDKKRQLAYEVTVYCYNQNEKEGKAIVDSFKFLK